MKGVFFIGLSQLANWETSLVQDLLTCWVVALAPEEVVRVDRGVKLEELRMAIYSRRSFYELLNIYYKQGAPSGEFWNGAGYH